MHHKCTAMFVAMATVLSLGTVAQAVDTNVFTQISDPAGFVNQVSYHQTTTEVSTVSAPWVADGDRFTHWRIGSTELSAIRIEDDYGKGVNPVPFTILEDTVAVAHYLDQAQDLDGDGIPDWYEIHYFNTTNNAPASDSDGDGISLLEEYRRDLHPGLGESVVDGGRSRRRSELVTMILQPGFFTYQESSAPAGFVDRSLVVSNGNAVATPSLHGATTGFEFGYWTVDGVRQADVSGRALDLVTTVVTADVDAVAHYFKATEDTDSDGIPDWWEWHYLGALSGNPTNDLDVDGLIMLEEYRRDLHPSLVESVADGSASRRRSELTTYDISGLVQYTINSVPAGFQDSSGYVTNGQVVATPSLHGAVNGYTFAYWTVNEMRAEDARGVAIDQVVVPLFTNTVFAAHYFKTTDDLDGDGIQDWWEWMYLGGTNSGSSGDHDRDGLTALAEFRRGLDPTLRHTVIDGGRSRRRSPLTLMNMQPFERLAYAQVDGIVSNIFTIWPPAVTGFDFGTNAAPALGDWDGDGDADLFVTSGGGALAVYENIGSRHVLNITERSVPFSGLVADLDTSPISCGDWSGDGIDDLAVGGGSSIRLRSSPGDFVSSPSSVADVPVPGVTNAVPGLGDLNGDELADLAVLTDGGQVLVYTNSGNQAAPFPMSGATNVLPEPVPQAVTLAISDVNRDSRKDLLITDEDGRTWEFRAKEAGGFLLYNKMWAGTGYGFAEHLTIAVGDLDGDTDMDAICGYAQGGLMLLRDPKLGPPANLRALGGALSVQLYWNPDPQARVRGYYVYRSSTAEGPFERLTPAPVFLPAYLDRAPVLSATNFYRVTALTMAHYPGSTVAKLIEGPASDTVAAEIGKVDLNMLDYAGQPGSNAVLHLSVVNAYGIAATGLSIEVTYDPATLTPREQITSEPTVEPTGLSRDIAFTDNGALAGGTLLIEGVSGSADGDGHLFDVNFIVDAGATNGTLSTNTFGAVSLHDTLGRALAVDASATAILTVSHSYFLGDVNGDGIATMDDHHHLLWLLRRNTREPTPQELAAGDMNGDGRLSVRDIPLLLRMLHDLRREP